MSEETGLERADRLEAEGRHEELVGQLIELLEGEGDPARRMALYRRASAALEGPLGSAEDALMVSLQAFDEFPDDGHFAEWLARLADGCGAWHRVLAAYENACERWQGEPATAATFHRRLAGWYALQGEATEVLRHRLTLSDLDPGDRANEDALIDALEDAGEWAVVAELWKGRLVKATDPGEQAAARARLVELYEGRLNRPGDALALTLQAFEAAPDDARSGELARLAERARDWQPVFNAYEAFARWIAADPDRAEVIT
ncbi:MAG: hypothetical protein KC613_19385, partial [Myxococcales bacterium]|nr:hypothetical protein [Myxococcales bacterium]